MLIESLRLRQLAISQRSLAIGLHGSSWMDI